MIQINLKIYRSKITMLALFIEIINDLTYGFLTIEHPGYFVMLFLVPSLIYYIILYFNILDCKIRFMNMLYKLSLTLYFISDSIKYKYLIVFYILNLISIGCYAFMLLQNFLTNIV